MLGIRSEQFKRVSYFQAERVLPIPFSVATEDCHEMPDAIVMRKNEKGG